MSPARHPRSVVRIPATVAVAGALLLLPAGGASAHVRVVPDTTTEGGYAELTFRVPNESQTAGTVGLTVDLPTATPFTSVSVRPVTGWTAVVTEATLPGPVDVEGTTITTAPATVTWTADPGTQIHPGEYQTFSVSVGRLPDAGTVVVLPATQTYSDGTEVLWDDVESEGVDAEHPAPSLTTTAPEPEVATTVTAAAVDPATPPAAVAGAAPSATWMDGAGLGLGVVALALALVAVVRTRRTAGSRS
ncbi:MAG: nuclear export factor [Actinotalea sp.]|nr:nuclear export factor [Actinotalea sp.]